MQNPPSRNEAAEIKEALGRLYKRVEEAEVTQKEQREKDRQVLNLWAETNLIQTELLQKQTRLIDQLTQELQKNESYWQKFARSSGDLMRDLLTLRAQLTDMLPPARSAETPPIGALASQEDPALNLLPTHRMQSKEMMQLEAMLAQIGLDSEEMPTAMRLDRLNQIAQSFEEIRHGKRTQRVTFDVVPLSQQSAIRMMTLAAGFIAATVAALVLFLPKTSTTPELKATLNTINTRLTRIEKNITTTTRK